MEILRFVLFAAATIAFYEAIRSVLPERLLARKTKAQVAKTPDSHHKLAEAPKAKQPEQPAKPAEPKPLIGPKKVAQEFGPKKLVINDSSASKPTPAPALQAAAPVKPAINPPYRPDVGEVPVKPESKLGAAVGFLGKLKHGSSNSTLKNQDIYAEEEVDDLLEIEGLTERMLPQLRDAGFTSYSDIELAELADLKATIQTSFPQVSDSELKLWRKQASYAGQDRWEELDNLKAMIKKARQTNRVQ